LSASTPVISMTNSDFARYSMGGRGYSLMVFCNARKIPEARALKLDERLKNLAVLAKRVRASGNGPFSASRRVFFVELDMSINRDLFMALGVQTLPWAVHVSPQSTPGCALVLQCFSCVTPHASEASLDMLDRILPIMCPGRVRQCPGHIHDSKPVTRTRQHLRLYAAGRMADLTSGRTKR
jgi:OST3 / OST6 family, transporter family